MNDKHYLTKVLALSSLPRVLTFSYKLISLPLMIRSLGAAEYGVVVYIGAIIAVLESFVDFGISSAAGKNIAAARDQDNHSVYWVVHAWARYQARAALIGLLPLIIATYYFAIFWANIEFDISILLLLVIASWLSISINFIRASLTSLLAFRSLAILDTSEAFIRCTGWLAVAFLLPSAMGFAIANLITVVVSASLAAALFAYVLRHIKCGSAVPLHEKPHEKNVSKRWMLKESLEFLWLRFVTRIFQSTPIMLFGRMGGGELVGIVGAITRVIEMLNFPFGVIGNALAVRTHSIISSGTANVKALWDAVTRFIILSSAGGALVFLCAKPIGNIILPESGDAELFIRLLSLTVITMAIMSVVAPMSDYVGTLRKRNIVLTVFAVLQIPIIFGSGYYWGEQGGVISHVLILLVISFTYLRIAVKAFFPNGGCKFSPVHMYVAILFALGLIAGYAAGRELSDCWFGVCISSTTNSVLAFIALTLIGLLVNNKSRRDYLTLNLFKIGL